MEYKAPERYILHLHGKSSEEVKLFIDDTWSKMFQEQRLKLCELSTFFAMSLPKKLMIPSPAIKSISDQRVTWTNMNLWPERFAKGLCSVTLQPNHLTDTGKEKN